MFDYAFMIVWVCEVNLNVAPMLPTKMFPLLALYSRAFVCVCIVGAFAAHEQLTPVVKIDGRRIGDGRPGPVMGRLRQAFVEMTRRDECATPLPDFD